MLKIKTYISYRQYGVTVSCQYKQLHLEINTLIYIRVTMKAVYDTSLMDFSQLFYDVYTM